MINRKEYFHFLKMAATSILRGPLCIFTSLVEGLQQVCKVSVTMLYALLIWVLLVLLLVTFPVSVWILAYVLYALDNRTCKQ